MAAPRSAPGLAQGGSYGMAVQSNKANPVNKGSAYDKMFDHYLDREAGGKKKKSKFKSLRKKLSPLAESIGA